MNLQKVCIGKLYDVVYYWGCYYELKKIDKIIKSDIVYGPYDIIVKINADDLDQIKQMVNFQIKQIQGVKYVMILPLNNKSENIKKI